MAAWYYSVRGSKVGPLDDKELLAAAQRGEFGPEDSVWREGLANWVPAKTVKGLFKPPAAAPAEPPPMKTAGPPPLPQNLACPIQYDDGPFYDLEQQFQSPKWPSEGPAFFSAQAFYLIKAAAWKVQSGGGLVPAIITAAANKLIKPDCPFRTCTVGELPPGVRAHADAAGQLAGADAIVLTKASISYIKSAGMGLSLAICVGRDEFRVMSAGGIWRKKAFKQALADYGWKIEAPLQPTAAPSYTK